MKKLLLTILLVTSASATPTWYHHLDDGVSNYYIGYGQARSEKKARDLALDDIAAQISTTVDNTLTQSLSVENEAVHTKIKKHTSHKSYAKLQGYKIVKYANESGTHFIALSYQNIPSIVKFNHTLDRLPVDTNEVQNIYLKKTPIAKKLSRKVNFSLLRKDRLWYIQYKENFQLLDPEDFRDFFSSEHSEELLFSTNNNQDVFYEGDEFYFKIFSKKSGYITIFTVYEDGTVATLLRNRPIKKGKLQNFPDKETGSIFQAGLIVPNQETFDLYVVLFSQTEKAFDAFASADERLIEDEPYKNFDTLIDLLDKESFSSLKITTKPK